jgi:hypothetical protein
MFRARRKPAYGTQVPPTQDELIAIAGEGIRSRD